MCRRRFLKLFVIARGTNKKKCPVKAGLTGHSRDFRKPGD